MNSLTRRMIVAAALLSGACEPTARQREQHDRKQHERNKRLDHFYEVEWIKCVNELGFDRCKIIQETGFRQCRGWKYGERLGMAPCAQERFDDRFSTFPEESPDEAPDEAPEAEAPQEER